MSATSQHAPPHRGFDPLWALTPALVLMLANVFVARPNCATAIMYHRAFHDIATSGESGGKVISPEERAEVAAEAERHGALGAWWWGASVATGLAGVVCSLVGLSLELRWRRNPDWGSSTAWLMGSHVVVAVANALMLVNVAVYYRP